MRPSLGAGRRVDQRMRWFAASGRGRPVRLRSGAGLSCGRASCRACPWGGVPCVSVWAMCACPTVVALGPRFAKQAEILGSDGWAMGSWFLLRARFECLSWV